MLHRYLRLRNECATERRAALRRRRLRAMERATLPPARLNIRRSLRTGTAYAHFGVPQHGQNRSTDQVRQQEDVDRPLAQFAAAEQARETELQKIPRPGNAVTLNAVTLASGGSAIRASAPSDMALPARPFRTDRA